MKKYLLPIIVVGSAIIFGSLGFAAGYGKAGNLPGLGLGKGSGAVSPDILFLTNPVTNLSGKVEKVSGSSVWVSTQYTRSSFGTIAAAPPVAGAAGQGAAGQTIPTPATKNITFKVNVTSKTSINRPPVNIPYLLKNQNPQAKSDLAQAGLLPGVPGATGTGTAAAMPTQPPPVTVKDIKIGQFISVTTSTDLREAKLYDVEATSIQLPPIVNSLNGKITKISGNTFTLAGIVSTNGSFGPVAGTVAPPKTEEFQVSITANTEISRLAPPEQPKEGELPKPPQAEKLSVSDLKEDMAVTVYTDVDISINKKFTAMRIEPQIVAAPILPAAVPTNLPAVPPVVSPTVIKAASPTVVPSVTPVPTKAATSL